MSEKGEVVPGPRAVEFVFEDDDGNESKETYKVQRFRGLKAILVIALLSRIGKKVPSLIAKATREFRRDNSLEITPMMAKLSQWVGNEFTEEDFQKGGGHVEVPAPMSPQEQIMTALPDLIDGARQELFQLLALLITPNVELKIADKKDGVYELLEEKAEPLYDADLADLADLIIAGGETIEEQLAEKGDRLGKLLRRIPWVNRMMNQLPEASEETPEESPETQTQKTSTQDAPNSSTDSEKPTDGVETERSTEPLGVS